MSKEHPHPDPIVAALEAFVRRVRLEKLPKVAATAEAASPAVVFDRWATITLVLLGVDAALAFTLAEDLLDRPIVKVLSKTVPFLFGAYFVAALEQVRYRLQVWTASHKFRWLVVGSLLTLAAVHMLNFFPVDLRVVNAASGTVEVDRTPRQIRHEVLLGAPLGFRRQALVSRDWTPTGLREDSVYIGLSDRFRATRLAATLFGPYAIDLGNTYNVVVPLDEVRGAKPELLVSGWFARSFLRHVEGVVAHTVRPAHPFAPLSWGPAGTRDSAEVSFVLNRMPGPVESGSSAHISLPAGVYVVRLVDGSCQRMPGTLRVVRDAENEVNLGLRPCEIRP